MRSGPNQRQHQHFGITTVNQQPVRFDVAFTVISPVAGQLMIATPGRKLLTVSEELDNSF